MKQKTNLGSIITTIDPAMDIQAQKDSIESWRGSAGSTWIWGQEQTLPSLGYNYNKSKGDVTTLREALVSHFSKIRGRETIGIVMPGVELTKDFSPLFNLVDNNKIIMNWAAKARAKPTSFVPNMFIITTSILPHIIIDLPAFIPFSGLTWADWLDSWLTKRMQPHMYIDASDLRLVSMPAEPVLKPLPVLSDPEPTPVVKTPKKAKKRKKKAS